MLAHGEECRVDRYLISIDIGTQGTKAALLDEQLQVIGTSFEASRLLGEKAGEIWQEPDEIYGSCVRTVRNLMAEDRLPAAMLPKYFGGSISVRSSMRRRRHLCFHMAM